jgi:hypothetical protein
MMANFVPDDLWRGETPYEDIGSADRPGPYTEVEHLRCPVCRAGPKQKCVNPVTAETRKVPCIGRIECRA